MPEKIERTPEDQKKADKMFDALRDELLKRDLSNTESYDKAILTLSSTALGVSLTAIKFVVPLATAEYIWLIKLGWLFLLISITSSLSAYLISNKALIIQTDNARDYYINGIKDAFNRPNVFITLNDILNKVTGLIFIAALAAIVAFVIINIDSEGEKMSNENGNTATSAKIATLMKKSANIPTIQQVPAEGGENTISANVPTMEQAPGSQGTSQGSEGSGEGSSSTNDNSSNSD